jgi:hypothetical protein
MPVSPFKAFHPAAAYAGLFLGSPVAGLATPLLLKQTCGTRSGLRVFIAAVDAISI